MPQVDVVTFLTQTIWLITLYMFFYFIFSFHIINIFISNFKNRNKINIKRNTYFFKYFFNFPGIWVFSNNLIYYSCHLLNKLFFELFLFEVQYCKTFNVWLNHKFIAK